MHVLDDQFGLDADERKIIQGSRAPETLTKSTREHLHLTHM